MIIPLALTFFCISYTVAVQRHLPHAPITEAVIDFVCEPQPGQSLDDLEAAFTSMNFGYSLTTPLWTGVFGMVMNPNAPNPAQSSANAQKIGIRANSEDGKYVAVFRINGFGLSRLAPYQDWAHLENEAQRIWLIYKQRYRIAKVTRIATRYINNLRLPLSMGESFDVYINKLIDLPPELPQACSAFVQQFQLLDKASTNITRVALSWDGRNTELDRAPVILDIDVFREQQSFDPNSIEIWQLLGSMQALKNQIFFGLLTEEAIANYL